MLQEKELEQIKKYLAEKLSPYLVILFGSAAKGIMRKDSDIDIALLSDHQLDEYGLFLHAQELASLINRDVDLVDLEKASTVFQAQIVGTGRVIHCTDEHRRMLFQMLTLKKYAKLNEERKPILDKIKERGSIYAE